MKKFEIKIMEHNNSNLSEEKIKKILNDALKSRNAGEVLKVTELKTQTS